MMSGIDLTGPTGGFNVLHRHQQFMNECGHGWSQDEVSCGKIDHLGGGALDPLLQLHHHDFAVLTGARASTLEAVHRQRDDWAAEVIA